MTPIFLVMAGGAAGSGLRYLISTWLPNSPSALPWATIIVNLIGSCVLGIVTGLFIATGTNTRSLYLLLGTGFCGGFTTLSTFSLEALHLIQSGQPVFATIYVAITVVGGLAFAVVGLLASRVLIT